MPKNIVICCDGTNNQFDGHHTNVVRLYEMADETPGRQICYYDPGVGTMPAPGLMTDLAKRTSVLWGLMGGGGFLDNVTDAYRFLMAEYEEGDQVYLFGFSRGAYTVRALAGMVYKMGLLYPNTENLMEYAVKYWRASYPINSAGDLVCKEFKERMARPCDFCFMGLWDTVGAVGFFSNFRVFPYTRHNPAISTVRHAVSIDERRCFFRKNLFEASRENPEQDVKNVWFSGVHSDVGGGYPGAESGLSKIALQWIVDEAVIAGLNICPATYAQTLTNAPVKPDPTAQIHESLAGFWNVAEILPVRRWTPSDRKYHWGWSLGERRTISRGSLVHESVPGRMLAMENYRPKNLPGPNELAREFVIIS